MNKDDRMLTKRGVLRGLRLAIPLTPGILAAGAIYGAVCRAVGIAGTEATSSPEAGTWWLAESPGCSSEDSWMLLEINSLVAILGMAAVTYATRATGLWLVGRGEARPFLSACLRHAPGAILVALLAPIILAGGLPTISAALVTLLASLRTGNLAVAMLLGVVAAALMEVVR